MLLNPMCGKHSGREHGTTIIETVIAAGVLLTCIAGVLSLFTLSTGLNAGHGENATRNTEFAAAKIDHLMALPFNDPGLGGSMSASSTAGGIDPASPVSGYVDYLDRAGALLSGASNAAYIRQWQIVSSAAVDSSGAPRLKTITVVTRTANNVSGKGIVPPTTLVSVKANF